MVAAAVVGGAVVGGVLSSGAQKSAAKTAANATTEANTAAVEEQRRQFEAVQELLKPYASAGTGALTAQQNLIGLNGASAQQSAIDAIKASPAFTSAQQLGETSILQNASATGGLRGGNTQAALAQFSPQLLTQLIQQQYSNLGGLTSIGQNAAAGVGNAGMQTGNTISGLLANSGQANAANALAQGQAQSNLYSTLGQGVGSYAGFGGFGSTGLSSGYSGSTGYVGGADPLGNFIQGF